LRKPPELIFRCSSNNIIWYQKESFSSKDHLILEASGELQQTLAPWREAKIKFLAAQDRELEASNIKKDRKRKKRKGKRAAIQRKNHALLKF
jgi:hypothetical protein